MRLCYQDSHKELEVTLPQKEMMTSQTLRAAPGFLMSFLTGQTLNVWMWHEWKQCSRDQSATQMSLWNSDTSLT